MRMALTRTDFAARSGLAAAVSIAALVMLSGCDDQPYPAPVDTAPPTAPAPSELMGAPENAPPPPPAAYGPPPAYAPPPPAAYAPPASDTSAGVVAMAPIPNPGDPGSEPYYGSSGPRVHKHYEVASADTGVVANPWAGAHRHHHDWSGQAAVPAAGAAAAAAVVPPHKTHAHPIPAPQAAPAAPGSGPAAVSATTNSAPGIATLQASLASAIAKTAVLNAPDQFTPNQPTDVSLIIPASFFDTVRSEAQKNGLSEAAASVNMAASLAGDGYAVLPTAVQTSPLASGQPTEFHWTVTSKAGAAGPLHADVGATLLGGGSMPLTLGSVQKAPPSGFKLTPRVVGASLLVLIGGLIVAWLARSRSAAPPSSRRTGATTTNRPLDMGGDAPPPT